MIKIFIFLLTMSCCSIFSIICLNKEIYLEISSFSIFSSFNWAWVWKIDMYSLIFSFIVLWISMIIFIYSFSYMKYELEKVKFFIILFLFVSSMYVLIFSFNLSSLLMGWDGLGVSSFLLIFFFHSPKSVNSSLVTILINRLGDLFMIFSIGLSLIYYSWNYMLWPLFSMFLILMICAFFTKSAQMPFSVWLPKAMAAPTPVSSLVHSSTLVTAGIYILFRLPYSIWAEKSMLVLSTASLTMMISSLMAFSSFDCKEIVAFSTMSHMSLIFMTLSINLHNLAFFHLCSHALFKSLLFMCMGNLIFHEDNSQDIRKLDFSLINPMTKISGLISIISMMGLPFMCGFYSKDGIFENITESSLVKIFVTSSLLTALYSFRLMNLLFSNFFFYNELKKINLMNWTIYIQSFLVSMGGSVFFWLVNSFYFIYPMLNLKMLILIFIMSGFMLSLKSFYIMKIINFYNLWFKMAYEINFIYIKSKLMLKLEKGWLNFVLIIVKNLKIKVILVSTLSMIAFLVFVLVFYG
uniref:NADH-ubiquinone oxidoreductase chain 5 n=1 Tax=Liposcelis nr. bostrychophila AZ TaxID=1643344 RepID=A0A0F6T3R9_9NEOP|nr:NADH dehydrogenase subunit 5 [Liposcelis nr. bostrychophila AZ]